MDCKQVHTVLECKDCGTVIVVSTKDLWHFIRCTHCDSMNVVNITGKQWKLVDGKRVWY